MKKQHQQFEVMDRKALRHVHGGGVKLAATVCSGYCGGGLTCPEVVEVNCECHGRFCIPAPL